MKKKCFFLASKRKCVFKSRKFDTFFVKNNWIERFFLHSYILHGLQIPLDRNCLRRRLLSPRVNFDWYGGVRSPSDAKIIIPLSIFLHHLRSKNLNFLIFQYQSTLLINKFKILFDYQKKKNLNPFSSVFKLKVRG